MWLQTVLGLALCLMLSESHPTGAGGGACTTLLPNHQGNLTQTTPAPISIVLLNSDIQQGQLLQVTFEGHEEFLFRGFIIQARTTEAVPRVVGIFLPAEGARAMNCANAGWPENSVWTHTNREQKESFELTWEAPHDYVGIINFQ